MTLGLSTHGKTASLNGCVGLLGYCYPCRRVTYNNNHRGKAVSDLETNRMLLELEKVRRDINRSIMNPEIKKLSIDDIKPVVTMAAKARLSYIHELMDIARLSPEMPSYEQVQKLARERETYEELRAAVNALETAIDRGYLDVLGS